MPYSAYTDVAGEFKNITFSSSTSVTDTQVTAFIAQADAIINGRIGVKYALPITDADALNILKTISTAIVADRVRAIVETKTASQDTNQQTRRGGGTVPQGPWQMLDAIVKGDMVLGSAALKTSTDGLSSGNVVDSVDMIMDADSEQW